MSPAPDPVLFRANLESWIGRLILPFLFSALLMVTVVNMLGIDPVWAGGGLLVLSVVMLFEHLLPMLFNWLKLDTYAMEGALNGRRFHIRWSEIMAAWVANQGERSFLCVGTGTGTMIFPLRFFDANKVWSEVRARAPKDALEPSAIQRLPDVRDWVRRSEELVSSPITPRQVVDHWVMQVGAWGCVSFFAINVANGTAFEHPLPALAHLLLCLLAVLVLGSWGVTCIDSEGLTRRTMTGTCFIRWDEVQRVLIDPFNFSITLEGKGKQVSLSGPALWLGSARDEITTILHAQAQYRRIPLHRSFWAMLKFSKNAKIKPR